MKGKKLTQVISVGLLILVMIFSIVTYAKEGQAKPITLVLTTHEAPGGTYQKGFYDPWIAEMEKRTNGKIKIEAHFGGELVGLPDAYDAARKGSVDIANFLTQMVVGKFPMDAGTLVVSGSETGGHPVVSRLQFFEFFGSDGLIRWKRLLPMEFSFVEKEEFERIATRVGFRVVDVYGSYDRAPFDPKSSPAIIFVLEKVV